MIMGIFQPLKLGKINPLLTAVHHPELSPSKKMKDDIWTTLSIVVKNCTRGDYHPE